MRSLPLHVLAATDCSHHTRPAWCLQLPSYLEALGFANTRFSDDVIDVAEEWVFEPMSLIATFAIGFNRLLH